MKYLNLSKINNVKMPNVNLLKRKDKIIVSRVRYPSRTSTMSSKTKDFIHRICYRKFPSVDMTRYGFITNRSNLAYVMLKPLKIQLEKILGHKTGEKIITPRRYASATQRGFLRSKSKKNIGQYYQATSGPSRRKTSSIQVEPIYKTKKKWG